MRRFVTWGSQFDWPAIIGSIVYGSFFVVIASAVTAGIGSYENGNLQSATSSIGLNSQDAAAQTVAYYTKVLAWFTAALAIVSAFQLWAIRRSDETARIAANAAKDSADAVIAMEQPIILAKTPEQFLRVAGPIPDLGPYGGTVLTSAPNRYSAFNDLTFENHGRTHAYPRRLYLGWSIGPELPVVPAFQKTIESPKDSLIKAGIGARVGTRNICIQASIEEVASMAARMSFIWVFGKLEYSDFLDRPREAWFFWKWDRHDEDGVYEFIRPVVVPDAYTRKG